MTPTPTASASAKPAGRMTVMVGPPGAGKSELIAARFPDALVLSPENKVPKKGDLRTFTKFMAAMRVALAAGTADHIIANRTNPRLNQRAKLIEAAAGAGYRTAIIYMPTDIEICARRLPAHSEHPLDERNARQALGKYLDDLVPPAGGEADEMETVGAPPPGAAGAAGGDIDAAVADKIVLLMIGGLRRQTIADACREKLQVPPDRIDAAMADARRRITLAADYDRDEMLGEAIARLDDLYQRSLRVQDIKTALAAQREKDRLLLGTVAPAAGRPAAADPPAGADREIENAELAGIVDAIETAIEPLDLGPGADVNDADLILLAGAEIARLRRAAKKKKAARKKA